MKQSFSEWVAYDYIKEQQYYDSLIDEDIDDEDEEDEDDDYE
jgi:hypothetical protein